MCASNCCRARACCLLCGERDKTKVGKLGSQPSHTQSHHISWGGVLDDLAQCIHNQNHQTLSAGSLCLISVSGSAYFLKSVLDQAERCIYSNHLSIHFLPTIVTNRPVKKERGRECSSHPPLPSHCLPPPAPLGCYLPIAACSTATSSFGSRLTMPLHCPARLSLSRWISPAMRCRTSCATS